MDKNNNIMKGQGEDGKWITVNGTHVFVQEGQSVEDAMNSKFDKSHPAKRNETNNEVLSVSKALGKTGKATTQNKEVADMYKQNANPYHSYTVKETPNGYEISVLKNKKSTTLVGSQQDSDAERERLKTHLGALGRNVETFSSEEYGNIYVKVDKHPQYSNKKHFIFWTDNCHQGSVNNYAEHLTFDEVYRRLTLCKAEYL